MRGLIVLGIVALAIIIATATSRSQSPDLLERPGDEPITGKASKPLPESHPTPKNPFEPYDHGPQNELWQYQQLNDAERRIVDHGRISDYSAVNDGYRGAARQLGIRAKVESAETQLGADNLDTTGVVP